MISLFEIREKVKRLFTLSVSLRVFSALVSFASSVLINRSIGIELKGQYSTILSFSNYAQMILNLGICYAYATLIKKYGESKARASICSIVWVQTSFYAIIAILMSPFLSKTTEYIVLVSLMIICNSQISFIAIIDNIKTRNKIVLLSTFLNFLMNLGAFLFLKRNLDAIIVFLLVRYVFETLLLSAKYRFFSCNVKILDVEILRTVFKIGLPTAVMTFLIACNYNLDIIMLNAMKSSDLQIGIYGVAYSLSNMLWIVPDAFKEMVYHKTAKDDNYQYIVQCLKMNFFICLIICFAFFLLGKLFLKIMYGDEFVVAFDVTLMLFIGIFPMIAFKLIHPLYVNNGKSKIVIYLLLIAILSNVVASYMLIPDYGAFGAAIATIISYSLCGMLFFGKFYIDYKRKAC